MTYTCCSCGLQIDISFCEFLSLSFMASSNSIVGVIHFIQKENARLWLYGIVGSYRMALAAERTKRAFECPLCRIVT